MEHTGRAVAQRRSLNRSKAYGSDRRTALQGTRFRACTGTGTAFTVLTVKRVVSQYRHASRLLLPSKVKPYGLYGKAVCVRTLYKEKGGYGTIKAPSPSRNFNCSA